MHVVVGARAHGGGAGRYNYGPKYLSDIYKYNLMAYTKGGGLKICVAVQFLIFF